MIRFWGGPADNATLALKRAPRFLRVVHGPRGKLDALDQLDDQAEPQETISVYRQVWVGPTYHLKGNRGVTGFWPTASYQWMPHVNGESVRSTDAWRAWCLQADEAQLQFPVAEGSAAGRCVACGVSVAAAVTLCTGCVALTVSGE